VIQSVINTSWAEMGRPGHRYFAFDKRTGDVVWIASPGAPPPELNTQSYPVIAVIDGRRLYINGNADGNIYALEARTGKKVWEIKLNKTGINTGVVVGGDSVYVSHSEENLDEATMGRVLAVKATGSGDITSSGELWRQGIEAGFSTPLLHDGRLYVLDNSANLYALDAQTGERRWTLSLGTVGKSAPVWADGRIYVTEVNGHLLIVEPGEDSAKILDKDQMTMPDGRYAEVYGSVAVAYGRLYLTSEEGLYCLGDTRRQFVVEDSPEPVFPEEKPGGKNAVTLLVVPTEITASAGETIQFEARAFDENGRRVDMVGVEWDLDGLAGSMETNGRLTLASDGGFQAGRVKARLGSLEGAARLRVFPPLPYREDFETISGERPRPYWIGGGRYAVKELAGNRVLVKPVAESGLLRGNLLVGPVDLSNYTIQVDLQATQQGRRRPDGGIFNSGYELELLGSHQRLELRSWAAMLRIHEVIDFAWEPGTWYSLKLRVDQQPGKAMVRGKVWRRGEPEPQAWTLSAEDPHPVVQGSPGILAYSPTEIYFDNLAIVENE
jgi:outer membrane protein assembly factor BamB